MQGFHNNEPNKGALPSDVLQRKRRYREVRDKETDEGWVSWSKAIQQEGEEVLLELVESGSIESRRHPKLPPTTTIKYPNNLQVYMVNERAKKTVGTADETELAEHEDATPECHENFINEYHGKRINAGSLASAGAAGGAESSVQSNASEKDSLCGSGGPPKPKVDEKRKSQLRVPAKYIVNLTEPGGNSTVWWCSRPTTSTPKGRSASLS